MYICKLLIIVFTFVFSGFYSKIYCDVNDFQLEVDYASFRYKSEKVNWELYYAIHHSNPSFERTENGAFRWMGLVTAKIFRVDSLIISKGWRTQSTVEDTTGGNKKIDILDAVPFVLVPGRYRIVITAKDLLQSRYIDSVKLDITVNPIPEEKISFSDIQLGLEILRESNDYKNPFYKNTMLVIPNPGCVYGGKHELLYFYTETYNLDLIGTNTEYTFQYRINDAQGNSIRHIKPVTKQRKSIYSSVVEWGSINVGSLVPGAYILNVALVDKTGNEFTYQSKKFFIDNPKKTEDVYIEQDREFAISEFAYMSEETLEREFEYIIYLAETRDRDRYKNIRNLGGKRKWMYKFWKRYDTNIKTLANEFRQEYMNRIEYTDQKFRAFKMEGWKTDRGRVYIQYGKPNYVRQYPNEKDYRPYTIWTYNRLQGGVEFVFVDFNSNGNYRLVHSTMQGEIQDYDWQSMVKKGVY